MAVELSGVVSVVEVVVEVVPGSVVSGADDVDVSVVVDGVVSEGALSVEDVVSAGGGVGAVDGVVEDPSGKAGSVITPVSS